MVVQKVQFVQWVQKVGSIFHKLADFKKNFVAYVFQKKHPQLFPQL
jgi:hypothetical protein